MTRTTIFVCDTCSYTSESKTDEHGRTGGEILAGLVEARAEDVDGVEVRRQSCLMGCEHPCNTAVAAPGKLTYVLGRFQPDPVSAEALVDYALLHHESESGQVPFRQWPSAVKGHFVARVPALKP